MLRPLARESSLLPAVVLAAFTLGVFYVLQNYGPESAVRRFHSAVAADDANALAAVTAQDVRSPEVRALILQVQRIPAEFRHVQFSSGWRGHRQVVIVAEYGSARGYKVYLPWLVRKINTRNWRVDALGTIGLMRRQVQGQL
jgi:hypothetical protein